MPPRPLLRERRRLGLEPARAGRPADDHRREQAERADRPEQEPPERDPARARHHGRSASRLTDCAAARCACARSARSCSRRRSRGSSAATCSRRRRALRSDVRHLGYNALVGAELIVARGPERDRAQPADPPLRLAGGQISPVNGTNCTPVQSPCPTRKVGVVKSAATSAAAPASPAPLFVNLVDPHEAEAGRARARRPAAPPRRPARGPPLPLSGTVAVELALDQRHRADHRVEERLELGCAGAGARGGRRR